MSYTKKELEKQIENYSIENHDFRIKNIELTREMKKLEDEIKELTRKKDNLLRLGNEKVKILQQIFKIITGEAKLESKAEVIRDMFLPQIKEEKKRDVQGNYYSHQHPKFSTDEIYEKFSRINLLKGILNLKHNRCSLIGKTGGFHPPALGSIPGNG